MKDLDCVPKIIGGCSTYLDLFQVGCTLTFALEAKFEIEAKIWYRLEAKKKPNAKHQKAKAKTKVK